MQANIEQTLSKLIAFPSASTNPDACRDIITFAAQELSELGLHTAIDLKAQHPWLLATTQPTKQPRLLLAAHLDTVPAASTSQLTAQTIDNKLYGRGAWDMKFAAACFIELLKSKRHILHQYDIGVLFTTDEEIGGFSVMELLASGLRADAVFLPDSSVPWAIEQRAKGTLRICLSGEGTAGHASRPWENDNALHKLLPVLEHLRSTYASLQPEGLTLNVTVAQSGSPETINVIPDHATAFIDIRSFSQKELDDIQLHIQTLASQHDLGFQVLVADKPLVLQKSNYYVESFVDIFTQQRGTALFIDAYGASDGRHFAKYNIPCIIVSPNGHGFHKNDEWVDVTDLEPYCRLLEAYVFKSNLFHAPHILTDVKAPVLDESASR